MVRIAAVAIPFVVVIAVFSACGGNGSSTEDGGSDASTDSGVDASVDGGVDAGEDGGPSHEAVDVSAGVFHTCAVIDGGDVKCWGYQQFGALGYGLDLEAYPGADTSMPSTLPFVDIGSPVSVIEASYYFTCALFESSEVLCWGFNSAGQLGQMTEYEYTGAFDVPADYAPIALEGPVAQISAGGGHACALMESGVLMCWGNNGDGQLGDGNGGIEHHSYIPVVAQVGDVVVQVSAGAGHTCAVLENGDVLCWGLGVLLGYGNTENVGDDEVPADVGPVDLGGPAVQVSAGAYHTCALLESGDVLCWGLGDNGELGYGNTDTIGDDEVPASIGPVDVGAPVVEVATGERITCVRLEGNDVKCWGAIACGLGYIVGDDETPASAETVPLGGKAVQLSAGSYHVCALMEDGGVRCWGVDSAGDLGYGPDVDYVGDNETPAEMGDVQLF